MADLSEQVLVLAPRAATAPADTHAALVVSKHAFENVRFSADFRTIAQLRAGSRPNEWESTWAVFNYQDPDRFYYVAFKPNGWELGKTDPAYKGGQRFLATGSEPATAIGQTSRFDIAVDHATITLRLDGRALATFTDAERPYLSGKVGFYTEDAKVAFDNVAGTLAENFDSYPVQRFLDGAAFGLWEVPFAGYGTVAIQTADSLF